MRALRRAVHHIGIVTILTGFTAFCAEARSNVEQVCLDHFHEVEVVGKKEHPAREAAVEAWYQEVKEHDGYQWAKLADTFPVSCQRRMDGWHCRLKHKPCRYVPVNPPAAVPVPRTVPLPLN